MKSVIGSRAIVTLLLLSGVPLLLAGGMAAPGEGDAILATVEGFLADLGELRLEQAAGWFSPGAVRIVSRKGPSEFSHTLQTVGEWMAELKNNPNARPFREELADPAITVESGHLAHVRAAFRIAREGTIVASGVNHFILQRRGETWKIVALAYTNLPEPAP